MVGIGTLSGFLEYCIQSTNRKMQPTSRAASETASIPVQASLVGSAVLGLSSVLAMWSLSSSGALSSGEVLAGHLVAFLERPLSRGPHPLSDGVTRVCGGDQQPPQ